MSLIQLDRSFFTTELNQKTESLVADATDALTLLKTGRSRGGEWTGWFDYPRKKGFDEVAAVEQYVRELPISYDLVVLVGVGGSYLGARACIQALSHTYCGFKKSGAADGLIPVVYAGHHLSEHDLHDLLDLLKGHSPLINVVSKSGTTTEPAVAFRVLRQYMEHRYGRKEAAQRIVVTTDAHKGALRAIAAEQGYASFVIPDDVGGRYSVLSPVGLVPIALAGIPVRPIMEGADQVFQELHQKDLEHHPVIRYGCARSAAWSHKKSIELMSYLEPRLFHLVEWWKQLYGESEGKEGKGIFPAGLALTTDLHSLGQLVQEGSRNLFETFLHFGHGDQGSKVEIPRQKSDDDQLHYLERHNFAEINEKTLKGVKLAHFEGGVPCLELRIPALDGFHLGALLAFFQASCPVSALLSGVNPFDQPGVEAYKRNLFGLLGKPGFEELGRELRAKLDVGP